MNAFGLSIIINRGCPCMKETIHLNGRKYIVKEIIGEGGFSTVLLVISTENKKKYAVKKIICHGAEDQKIALQEVNYHEMLRHPNILPCISHELLSTTFDATSGPSTTVYILLPYYPRGTLAHDLSIKEKLNFHMSCEDILTLFIHICDGIKVFHDFRPTPLAHHDIKPANILLSHDNIPVIMDLGSTSPAIVKISNKTEAQRIQDFAEDKCSMAYRAPELFNVETDSLIDQRTDIWSLGCLLYSLCYFKSPFDIVHERGDSVALAVVSGHITFPNNSSYPEELHEFIKQMLQVNPSERPFINDVMEKASTLLSTLNATC